LRISRRFFADVLDVHQENTQKMQARCMLRDAKLALGRQLCFCGHGMLVMTVINFEGGFCVLTGKAVLFSG